jgi:hypothetical protein
MGSNLTISTANATVLLPCATISTANQMIVTAGTRNVALRGCALRGAARRAGARAERCFCTPGRRDGAGGRPDVCGGYDGLSHGQRGDQHHGGDSATAQGLVAYRTQEMDLESLYFLGNANQTGMTLDGTGNYTGGTFSTTRSTDSRRR